MNGKRNILMDHILLKLLGKGNQFAFEEIFNRYWKRLYTYAYKVFEDEALHISVRTVETHISNALKFLKNNFHLNGYSYMIMVRTHLTTKGCALAYIHTHLL